MFKVFQHYGNIQEVVIPDKRNKLGRRFRFALFAHVYDEDRFGVELDNIIIIIGRGKIFVILPRFRRGRRGHRSTEVKNHKDHEEDNMKQGLNNKHQAKTDMDQRTFAKAVQNNNNDKKEDDCRKAEYHENLAKVTQTYGGATHDTQEVDGSQRIKIWKDVSKETPHNRAENQIIEAARAEAAAARADAEAARAEVAAARADADAARAEAAASTARTRSLEIKFEEFQSRMMALETASCSGHSRQSSHPHYDNELDDQSVDEEEDA
ncbi:unnamed protein product [Trifolium pratense]|uniref:Uncharacterized protein n=1 Tax=Trifolium pratense TaxID=57577 RepID=A0ACB0JKV1_TRIPR|nr:unnamed protein product [Trifolium pratense]